MRGQVWSADFIFSIVIVFVALTAVLFAWNYTASQASLQSIISEVENTGLFISDSLVRTSGLPPNWNTTNVQVVGLVEKENVLVNEKVNSFISMDYGELKDILGTGGYGFYFSLMHPNSTVVRNETGGFITVGEYPPEDASMIVPVERYVLYNRGVKKLSFILWVEY